MPSLSSQCFWYIAWLESFGGNDSAVTAIRQNVTVAL